MECMDDLFKEYTEEEFGQKILEGLESSLKTEHMVYQIPRCDGSETKLGRVRHKVKELYDESADGVRDNEEHGTEDSIWYEFFKSRMDVLDLVLRIIDEELKDEI